jgi:uncharacterized protein with FMN-binding domain
MKRFIPVFIAALALFGASAYAQAAPVYADGTYQLDYTDAELGSVSVSVVVADSRIESVSLPSGKGDVTLDDESLNAWLATFVAAPDYMKVDAVSGASQSCDLIKYAVQAALKKAAAK